MMTPVPEDFDANYTARLAAIGLLPTVAAPFRDRWVSDESSEIAQSLRLRAVFERR